MANPDAKEGYLNCWGSFEKAKWWIIVASLSCNAWPMKSSLNKTNTA
jgi:hypothetical protein